MFKKCKQYFKIESQNKNLAHIFNVLFETSIIFVKRLKLKTE